MFLAERLGLDPDERRSVEPAGLLHDVGKIGIPDAILRKPGAAHDDEYAIVKQHVSLGAAIVRDLPNVDAIRAGVRHHHERWDGNGYLDRLAGEEIPLIARILSVCDAFCAMTTTRPYRKALSSPRPSSASRTPPEPARPASRDGVRRRHPDRHRPAAARRRSPSSPLLDSDLERRLT